MPRKLDSSENLHSFKKYLTRPKCAAKTTFLIFIYASFGNSGVHKTVSSQHHYKPVWLVEACRVMWVTKWCAKTHLYVGCDSSIRVTRLCHTCDILIHETRCVLWVMCHDSFILWIWLVYTCDTTCSYVGNTHTWDSLCSVSDRVICHDSFIRRMWLVYTCGMTRSYVRHTHSWDILIHEARCVMWVTEWCAMTHLYVGRDSFIRVTRLVKTWDILILIHGFHYLYTGFTASYEWLAYVSRGAHMNQWWHTHEWVMSRTWMSHGTHMNESCHPYVWVYPTHKLVMTRVNKSWHIYE